MTNKEILFLLPYPLHKAPSQRFRVENLLFLLDEKNITYQLEPFLSESNWNILYKKGNIIQKLIGILASFFRRWKLILFKSRKFSFVFIHRESAPLGPPIIEWYLSKILRKKIVYDFDDAIWIPNTSVNNSLASLAKSFWKVKYICKWSYKVSAGNDFLCRFAEKSGAETVVKLPTVVDTITRYNVLKTHKNSDIFIGWTGSHSTLKFLLPLVPIIAQLQRTHNFTFLVIADQKPALELSNWEFCHWKEQTEIQDLLRIDIGVMPLTNDAWSEGKCGFKLIQYLSLGIPAVANSVGVNTKIIENGKNGFLAESEQEWELALKTLLGDVEKRKEMGQQGRKKMVEHFSIESQKENFLSLFQ